MLYLYLLLWVISNKYKERQTQKSLFEDGKKFLVMKIRKNINFCPKYTTLSRNDFQKRTRVNRKEIDLRQFFWGENKLFWSKKWRRYSYRLMRMTQNLSIRIYLFRSNIFWINVCAWYIKSICYDKLHFSVLLPLWQT